jgi:hypothetical protein
LTASTALPPGVAAEVINYFQGAWANGVYTPTSANGAIPAWIYMTSNYYFAVDAVTGQLLGSAPQ